MSFDRQEEEMGMLTLVLVRFGGRPFHCQGLPFPHPPTPNLLAVKGFTENEIIR